MADINIKEMIEELVEKILSDKALKEKFMKDPITVVEKLIGIDLPNDKIEKLVDGIKAKITIDDIGDALGALGGLFGKK
jgi:hypothetical protein